MVGYAWIKRPDVTASPWATLTHPTRAPASRSQHTACALAHLGDDLLGERLNLLVRHGLLARLDRHCDRDRLLTGLDAGAFVEVEQRHASDQLAVDVLRRAHEVAGLYVAIDHEREVALDRLERRKLECR